MQCYTNVKLFPLGRIISYIYIQVYFLKPYITYKQLHVDTITYFATCFPLHFYFAAHNFTIIFFLSNVEICHCNENIMRYNRYADKILVLSMNISQKR